VQGRNTYNSPEGKMTGGVSVGTPKGNMFTGIRSSDYIG
jgi:hypothetical protein